jgi:hypothetical protein
MTVETVGQNVQIEVTKDGKAIVTIDLNNRGGLSSSGKSIIVATTEGNKPIPGTNVVIGINCYVPNKK